MRGNEHFQPTSWQVSEHPRRHRRRQHDSPGDAVEVRFNFRFSLTGEHDRRPADAARLAALSSTPGRTRG
jgi:hypothetical protein